MNTRAYIVGRAEAGRPLADWLHARLGLPRPAVAALLRAGHVRLGGKPCLDPARRLRRGDRVQIRAQPQRGPAGRERPRPKKTIPPGTRRPDRRPAPGPPPGIPEPVVRYADDHVAVVDKPAGLT